MVGGKPDVPELSKEKKKPEMGEKHRPILLEGKVRKRGKI
jgi:hypothetical protein